MAADSNVTQEAILDFLKERGGKVKNTDLIEHFKAVFPEEPEKKAAVRNVFKNYVDNIAFVKAESAVKYVCLKKKFRGSVKEQKHSSENGRNEPETDKGHLLNGEKAVRRYPSGPDRAQVNGDDAVEPRAAGGGELTQQIPGSGYGNDSQVRVPPHFTPAQTFPEKTDDRRGSHEFVCVVDSVDSSSGEMGNTFQRDRRESKKEQAGRVPEIPEIAVIEASPLPTEGSMFTLPGPVQTGTTGQVDSAGLSPKDRQLETDSLSLEGPKEAEQIHGVTRHQSSRGSQHRRQPQSEEGDDEGQFDAHSFSGSEENSSPKGSRRHFIEVMMHSSPQVSIRGGKYQYSCTAVPQMPTST